MAHGTQSANVIRVFYLISCYVHNRPNRWQSNDPLPPVSSSTPLPLPSISVLPSLIAFSLCPTTPCHCPKCFSFLLFSTPAAAAICLTWPLLPPAYTHTGCFPLPPFSLCPLSLPFHLLQLEVALGIGLCYHAFISIFMWQFFSHFDKFSARVLIKFFFPLPTAKFLFCRGKLVKRKQKRNFYNFT